MKDQYNYLNVLWKFQKYIQYEFEIYNIMAT